MAYLHILAIIINVTNNFVFVYDGIGGIVNIEQLYENSWRKHFLKNMFGYMHDVWNNSGLV